MLAPISGYEDLAEKSTPLHKSLANVIRRSEWRYPAPGVPAGGESLLALRMVFSPEAQFVGGGHEL